MILLGRKKQLLSSDTIWYCSLCNTCSFVCPQGVKFSKAMVVIRQMAVESGYISGSFLDKWQQVEKLCQHFVARVLSSLLEVRDREGEIDLVHLLKDAYMQCTGGD
jgi:heterodisulfide reductase subunit C